MSPAAPSPLGGQPGRQRYVLLAFLFLHTLNTYVDRVCISAAKDGISRDLGISDQEMGYIFAAFAIGYALFQIPAGWLTDRLGARKALSAIVAMWSTFTVVTGLAASTVWLLIIRFIFGAAEAGAFPGAARAMYKWLPVRERGIAQGIFHSGARIGSALSLLLLPLLIRATGWRAAFFITGTLGLVWVAAWWWWYRDDPRDSSRVGAHELEYIESGLREAQVSPIAGGTAPNPLALLTSSNVLLLMFQAFASTFTFYISVTWFLPYLTSQWGQSADVYASIPPLLGAVALWSSGTAVTLLYQRGYPVTSRKAPAIAGKLIAATGLLLAVQAESLVAFVLLFALALCGVEFVTAAAWTTCMDIGREHTASVSASMNMAGNIGATLSAILFPFFVANVTVPVLAPVAGKAHSYFIFAAVMNILGACAWALVNPRRPVNTSVSSGRLRLRFAAIIVPLVLAVAGLVLFNLMRSGS